MKKYVIRFLIVIGLFVSVGTTFAAQDIMEVMFAPTKAHENIVDLGADKQDVGDEVFRSSYNIVSGETQAPLIVRITKFLLRMTIVLSVTMVLYNGVLWIVESSKGDAVKDAKNNLIYIFVGIALALLSVTLINLVSSIGVSSLDPSRVSGSQNRCIELQVNEDLWISNKCGGSDTAICSPLKSSHSLYEDYACVNTLDCTSLQAKMKIWDDQKCNLVTFDNQCASLIKYRNAYKDLNCK